jgi:hypothetical protein
LDSDISDALIIAEDLGLIFDIGTRNFCLDKALPDDFEGGNNFLELITAILSYTIN